MSVVMAGRNREPQSNHDSDEQIAALVDQIRANQRRIAALESHNDSTKEELAELLRRRGARWTDADGYALLREPGIRKVYDAQALDRLIVTDPLRYGWLKDYRKETNVRGGVQVK